jgi:hypothetical protein
MANTQTLIAQVYSAFNQRNVDGALALMSENVSWPKASEGGRVVGKEEIRAYNPYGIVLGVAYIPRWNDF